MKGLATLLLGIVMTWLPTAAMADEDVWVAYMAGEIDITPDGSVRAFKISDSLGEQLDRFVRKQVMDWRFEPVIENGEAVALRGRANLTLRGVRDGNSFNVSVASAQFFEFAGDASDQVIQSVGNHLQSPNYPKSLQNGGVMAVVSTVVSFNRNGKVEDVACERVDLRTLSSIRGERDKRRYASRFKSAVERVARSWTFNPSGHDFNEAGIVRVRVPVKFLLHGMDWGRLYVVESDEPVKKPAIGEIADAGTDGRPVSRRVALLTPLEPLPSGG